MKQSIKTWKPILYALLFLTAVLVLFYIYTTQNEARIQEQNKVYAEDCARQTASRITSEFDNALQRIQNSAYLVSSEKSEPEINSEVLKEIENNTTFDAIRFTNVDGKRPRDCGGIQTYRKTHDGFLCSNIWQ